MIHLPKKDIANPPSKLISRKSLELLREVVMKKNGDLLRSTDYKNKALTNLLKAFSIHKISIAASEKGKCNYCETKPEPGSPLQVEHYRPKAKVDPKDNKGVAHSGYYWLAMEWSNLLLSCPTCNGKSGKGNQFPIKGIRATEVQPVNGLFVLDRTDCLPTSKLLQEEKAMLINPEVEQPEQFLTFDILGNIKGHGPDFERGETTRRVCNLNRPILVADRLLVWDDLRYEILTDIGSFEMGALDKSGLKYCLAKIARKILNRRSVEAEFTLWGRFLNDKIEDFIVADVPSPYQDLFRKCYADEVSNAI